MPQSWCCAENDATRSGHFRRAHAGCSAARDVGADWRDARLRRHVLRAACGARCRDPAARHSLKECPAITASPATCSSAACVRSNNIRKWRSWLPCRRQCSPASAALPIPTLNRQSARSKHATRLLRIPVRSFRASSSLASVRSVRNVNNSPGGFSCGRLGLYSARGAAAVSARPRRPRYFGTIRGIVHDPQHRPMREHREVEGQSRRIGPKTTQTDDNGEFSFNAVPIGDYKITVTQSKFADFGAGRVRSPRDSSPVLHFPLAIAGGESDRRVSSARRKWPTWIR